jgi:hypothetical protein
MRPALDKLLASPSTLRFLRNIVRSPQPPDRIFERLHARRCIRLPETSLYSTAAALQARSAEAAATNDDTPTDETSKPSTPKLRRNQSDLRKRTHHLWRAVAKRRGSTLSDWEKLLSVQWRLHGDDGVRDVWTAMLKQNVRFPLSGQNSNMGLWKPFLQNRYIVKEVVALIAEMHQEDPSQKSYHTELYWIAMRTLIETREEQLAWMHQILVRLFPPRPSTLAKLEAFCRNRPVLYTAEVRLIIEDLRSRFSVEEGGWQDSASNSKDLETNSGGPKGTAVLHPVINEDAEVPQLDRPTSVEPEGRSRAHKPPPLVDEDHFIDPSSVKGVLGTETFNRFLGKFANIRPKTLDDPFIARLFATRAFGVESIIRGLHIFNVEEIGSVALREMAVRAHSPAEVIAQISALKDTGISVRQSIYCDAVQHFAQNGQRDMLWNLLNSDCHPDEYEDKSTLRALLRDYLARDDLISAQRVLTVLSLSEDDAAQQEWNELLLVHINRSSALELTRFTEDMLASQVYPTEKMLDKFHWSRLSYRRRGHAPDVRDRAGHDDLLLTTNFFRRILETQGHLDPNRWREIMKRFGMTNRLRELHTLMLWLADWYSAWGWRKWALAQDDAERGTILVPPIARLESGIRGGRLDLHSLHQTSPWWVPDGSYASSIIDGRSYVRVSNESWNLSQQAFQQLFPAERLSSLIGWSFKAMHSFSPEDRAPAATDGSSTHLESQNFVLDPEPDSIHQQAHQMWMLGYRDASTFNSPSPALVPLIATLRLLLAFRARGVAVHTTFVRSALRKRLWVLFGPVPGRVKANLRAMQRLDVSLLDVVRVVQGIWPGGVFDIDGDILERLANPQDANEPVFRSEIENQRTEDSRALLRAVFGEALQVGWRQSKNDTPHLWKRDQTTYVVAPRKLKISEWIGILERRGELHAICQSGVWSTAQEDQHTSRPVESLKSHESEISSM